MVAPALCSLQGLDCVEGWDDETNNECSLGAAVKACDHSFGVGTSDAVCKCGQPPDDPPQPPTSPPPPSPPLPPAPPPPPPVWPPLPVANELRISGRHTAIAFNTNVGVEPFRCVGVSDGKLTCTGELLAADFRTASGISLEELALFAGMVPPAAPPPPSPPVPPPPPPPPPPSPPLHVFELDFGDASHQSLYTLQQGAYIGNVDGIAALRVGDGKSANLLANINPSVMPDCTIEVSFKLLTVANNLGWLVSSDNGGGWDRSIIVHDSRFGGGVAAIPGTVYESGLPAPTLNEWSHVVVVYRQDGVSTAFLNGARGDLYSPTTNNEGFTTLTLGTIVANNIEHATDAWVKSITIWNEALSDVQVQGLYTASPCATNGQREGGHRCCLPWEWVWELDPGGGGDGKGKRPSASRPNGNASHRKAAEITAGAAARRGTRRHGQGEGERCGVDCC